MFIDYVLKYIFLNQYYIKKLQLFYNHKLTKMLANIVVCALLIVTVNCKINRNPLDLGRSSVIDKYPSKTNVERNDENLRSRAIDFHSCPAGYIKVGSYCVIEGYNRADNKRFEETRTERNIEDTINYDYKEEKVSPEMGICPSDYYHALESICVSGKYVENIVTEVKGRRKDKKVSHGYEDQQKIHSEVNIQGKSIGNKVVQKRSTSNKATVKVQSLKLRLGKRSVGGIPQALKCPPGYVRHGGYCYPDYNDY